MIALLSALPALGQFGNAVSLRGYRLCSPLGPKTDGFALLWDGTAGCWKSAAVTSAAGGTVTSAAQTFTGGLISVGGSPITSAGTLALTVAGTSGGVPYFSGAATWASSGAMAAGQFMLGGGAGSAPTTSFSIVPGTNGGSGINNGSFTHTLSGNVVYTGSFNPTFAVPSSSTWTFPSGGGSLALLGSTMTGLWNGTVIGSTYGGFGSALNAAASNTYPKSNGATPAVFSASTLAAGGIGACTNQVVTTINADAAPTCTTVTSAYTTGLATIASTNTFTGRQDAGGAASTAPAKVGTSLPGTCTVGDLYFKSDATAGQNIYECQSTNTWTQQLNSGGGGGSGTVTVVSSGNLTSTAVATGGGSQTIQTPSATTTLDTSGNFSTPGSYAAGVGGSVAGGAQFTQGTAPSAGTTSVTIHAPTSVTSYTMVLPAASATGFMLGTNASNVNTISYVGSSGSGSVCLTTSCSMTTPVLGTPTSGTLTNATGYLWANLASPPFIKNAQTGTYQVLAGDFTQCKTITVASGTFTVTLVASGSQPANGQCLHVVNYGSGVVTVARSGQNINGGTSSLTIPAATATAPTGADIVSDGTDYFATLTGAAGSGTGDFSSNTSSSVDSEIMLFSGTGGKTGKRATGTGLARVASGVYSAAELSGDATTSGSNVVTVAKINGVSVTGTPSSGQVPTATGSTAATWQTPSGGGQPGSTLFSTTASTTVTAASATTLIGAVSGSTTIVANTFTAGGVMEVLAQGYYTGFSTRTLTIDFKVGGTTRLTTGAIAVPVATNGVWRFYCGITTRTAGASGTQIGNCIFEATGATLTAAGEGPMQTASTWTVDTTGTLAIDLQATWDSTTGSPTITATNVAAWIPGAPVTSVNTKTGAITLSLATDFGATVTPIANGGTGTGSTLTGFVRGSGSAMSAGELAGDCTSSGSTLLTCTQINGSNFTVSTAGVPTKIAGIGTLGMGSPVIGWISTILAQTSSQSTVTVATAPSAGTYRWSYYVNQNALCTTGSNSVSFTFNWTDAGNARTLTTGSLSLGTAQSATTGYLSGDLPVYIASGNFAYTSTVSGTCASGTSSYDIHGTLEKTQ